MVEERRTVKRIIGGVSFLMVLLLWSSCVRTDRLDDYPSRTLLVYMAANNNLDSEAATDILEMSIALSRGRTVENCNLILFVQRANGRSYLLHVNGHMDFDTLATYTDLNSCDPSVLTQMIDYVQDEWKAESYGLILWSHGSGWAPTSQMANLGLASSSQKAPMRNGNMSQSALWMSPEPLTKAFGFYKKTNSETFNCIDLDQLASAIPDNVFEYIMFDACYMASVEVMYALRYKARYIIASSIEIMASGYPYDKVTRDFLRGNIIKCCNDFYDNYNNRSGSLRTAGIGIIHTDQLDSLAHCFKKIVAGSLDTIPNMDVSKIQRLDRLNKHFIYDLGDFVKHLGVKDAWYNEFMLQLDRCVPVKMNTPYALFDGTPNNSDHGFEINAYCGLSVYIPLSSFESMGLNAEYRKTDWSLDTGYR